MSNGCGVRGKTIEECIRDLANPDLKKSGNEADQIISMIENEKNVVAEKNYRDIRNLEKKVAQLKTEIKVLVAYIQMNDL